MKIKLLKSYNRFLAFLISILGFSSHQSIINCVNAPSLKYKTQHAKFKIKEKTTNTSDVHIGGIRMAKKTNANLTNSMDEIHVKPISSPKNRELIFNLTDTDKNLQCSNSSKNIPLEFTTENENYQVYKGETEKS